MTRYREVILSQAKEPYSEACPLRGVYPERSEGLRVTDLWCSEPHTT